MRYWLLGSILAVALAALSACGAGEDVAAPPTRDDESVEDGAAPNGDDESVEVTVGPLVIEAELARTPEERSLGLGGRDLLPEDAGMLFVFEQEGQPGFWMRGMRFPLDFIWISADQRVVSLTEDVPPPEPGTPDQALPFYEPDEPVLYVL
ncbi:MAG: DUF192 domain-containing protein, partial [Dehalococcoidia bacterium]|nr:DUF192 domain-containing protein [Dehalococcoidia bacterium]